MTWRRLFLACALLLVAVAAVAAGKRGVGIADRGDPDRINALRPAWYYTWTPWPAQGVVAAEFVPMVWGGPRLDEHVRALQGRPPVPWLLTFNEPDHARQADMSVQDALAAWPRVAALGQRVGSPATATPGNAWITSFVTQQRARGAPLDFIAVHLYGPPDPALFLRRLDAVHDRFGLPVWITEMGVADWDATAAGGRNRWSEAQVLDFMKAVLPELERRPWLQRYAWFVDGKRRPPAEALRPSRLFDPDGRLTELGRYYAAFPSQGP